ncbi:MAG: short chain dehydrogenase [Gammaproteobacteria bacterium]|nr:short chain dehydrogenase [Gammaproteobacteria bacterium]
MKILVIGASGTIGSAVTEALDGEHEVVKASRTGEVRVDLSDPASIEAMFQAVPELDAVLSTAGSASFGPLDSLSDEDFALSLGNKLMGQVNLVRLGRKHLNPGGVITLTTGILAHNPNPHTVILTMINRALEGFVESAALDMPNDQRLNGVCPPMVKETAEKMGWGPGGVPAVDIAKYYLQSIEPGSNGRSFGPAH